LMQHSSLSPFGFLSPAWRAGDLQLQLQRLVVMVSLVSRETKITTPTIVGCDAACPHLPPSFQGARHWPTTRSRNGHPAMTTAATGDRGWQPEAMAGFSSTAGLCDFSQNRQGFAVGSKHFEHNWLNYARTSAGCRSSCIYIYKRSSLIQMPGRTTQVAPRDEVHRKCHRHR
jgi:hypothetical protein